MKKITLDQLAVIVQKGFEKSATDLSKLAMRVEKGFEKSSADIEHLAVTTQKGFEETATDSCALTGRVDGLEQKFGELDRKMESGFSMISRKIDEIDVRDEVFDLQIRVGKLEKKAKT